MSLNIFSAEIADEYELKAALFEKFARFIDWPDDAANSDKPFEIVVIGENLFKKKLDNLYANQKIKNRVVKIRYINSIDQIGNCQILFISPSMSSNLTDILKKIAKKPILTVSQSNKFCERGGDINFVISSSKIKFQINEKAVRNSNLKISHLLLQYSTIINSEGE